MGIPVISIGPWPTGTGYSTGMARDSLHYDRMVESALRGVVRQALAAVVEQGLPGNHHFYLTFRTNQPGVEIADRLRAQYPQEMTIVLQHQFWGLEVNDEFFVVNLSFSNVPERLKVPYAALVSFVDPSVKFGLQFQVAGETAGTSLSVGEVTDKAAPPAKEPPPLALAKIGDKSPAEKSPAEKSPAAMPTAVPADKASDSQPKTAPAPASSGTPADEPEDGKKDPDKVISLDAFRKK